MKSKVKTIIKNAFSQQLMQSSQNQQASVDRQSSVAIILKINQHQQSQNIKKLPKLIHQINQLLQNLKNTQILLLQRTYQDKIYSGQICLPGGKKQANETPIQTAIRQTQQQTGLQLSEMQLLGSLNTKFIANKKGQSKMFTYTFIFILEQQQQIHLNASQIIDHRWVPFQHFFDESVYGGIRIDASTFGFLGERMKNVDIIDYVEWPAIDVGMGKQLYGFTLYILAYFVNSLIPEIDKAYFIVKDIDYDENHKNEINQIKLQLDKLYHFAHKFKNQYFQQFTISFNQKSELSEDQKQAIRHKFIMMLALSFPARPKF